MKSAVLVLALAAQCVPAKSQNGYGYSETSSVLEWIAYLKRLSLIALMLCGVVLYYVPESRSHARRVCCALIDLVANGLKFVINATEVGYEDEKIGMDEQNNNGRDKNRRIQELYRKVSEDDTRNYGRESDNKNEANVLINKDTSTKSVTLLKRTEDRKSRARDNVDGNHERHQRYNRHRNASIKVASSRSRALIRNSPRQMTMLDEKCKEGNLVIRRDINSERLIKNHQEDTRNTEIKLATHTERVSSAVRGIVSKSDVAREPMSESINGPYRDYINYLPMAKVSDNLGSTDPPNKELWTIVRLRAREAAVSDTNGIEQNLQEKQSFDRVHEEAASAFQGRSKNGRAARILNKQLAYYLYGEALARSELHDGLGRKSRNFLDDTEEMIANFHEHTPIIENRAKPVLLRVVNWFFGGCPEASRRGRIEEVGKEEISNAYVGPSLNSD